MEPLTKKKRQTLTSDSEAMLEETPQTLTLSSLDLKKKRSILPLLLNSSPHTLANHPPNLDHWLERWHKSQPPQPSPATAWWPEPWELGYLEEEQLLVQKESSGRYSPCNTIEEMEVEMILLNLTDKILENTMKEGQEVVEVEMTWEMAMGVAAAEEADLILQAMSSQLTQGHYRTR